MYKQQAADHSKNNVIIHNILLGKTNETYERYVFNTRKQKSHETVDDYISALCTLASTCNFCNCLKDSLLRDRIVLGINGSSTRKRLLQEADLNLETCIAMCRAAEAASPSPSQPVKTETWTENSTAVQAGSVSSADLRPREKPDFSLSLRRCDPMVSPDEVETSEVNFNTELDDSDDSALQWTTEHQSSDFPRVKTEHKKLGPSCSMEEDSPDQPSAVYSTVQPMPDNTSGSLLSLDTTHVCQHCSAAFVLISSLELHLASVHGDKLLMVLPGPSIPDRCDAGNCSNTDIDKEADTGGERKGRREKKVDDNDADDVDGKKRSRQHACDVCRKSFSKPSELMTHKVIHSDVRPFVCDVCSKSFTRACGLTQHKRIHSRERPYKCPHCDSSFKGSGNLQHHIKSVHGGARPHTCDVCGTGFSHSSYLTIHKRIHSGERPYVCSDCGKGFTSSDYLAKHRLIHTGEKPHVCSECGKGFTHLSSLTIHRRTHSGEKPYVCSYCGKGFTDSSSLRKHCRTHTGKLIRIDVRPFVCDVCGKSFTQAYGLTEHKKVHSTERPFKCPHCDSGFKYSGYLQHHIRSVHEGARPHLCDICGAAFSQSSYLTIHKRIHSGERPYVCSDCGKGFTCSDKLAKHRLIHTGEKPHVCSDCGKGFALASSLTLHRRTHSGDKPFVCSDCKKGFTSSSDLKKHNLTHTGEKPHVCSDCGKGFARSTSLSQHRVTHTGQKPHSCPHCPAAFKYPQQVKRHVLKTHQ